MDIIKDSNPQKGKGWSWKSFLVGSLSAVSVFILLLFVMVGVNACSGNNAQGNQAGTSQKVELERHIEKPKKVINDLTGYSFVANVPVNFSTMCPVTSGTLNVSWSGIYRNGTNDVSFTLDTSYLRPMMGAAYYANFGLNSTTNSQPYVGALSNKWIYGENGTWYQISSLVGAISGGSQKSNSSLISWLSSYGTLSIASYGVTTSGTNCSIIGSSTISPSGSETYTITASNTYKAPTGQDITVTGATKGTVTDLGNGQVSVVVSNPTGDVTISCDNSHNRISVSENMTHCRSSQIIFSETAIQYQVIPDTGYNLGTISANVGYSVNDDVISIDVVGLHTDVVISCVATVQVYSVTINSTMAHLTLISGGTGAIAYGQTLDIVFERDSYWWVVDYDAITASNCTFSVLEDPDNELRFTIRITGATGNVVINGLVAAFIVPTSYVAEARLPLYGVDSAVVMGDFPLINEVYYDYRVLETPVGYEDDPVYIGGRDYGRLCFELKNLVFQTNGSIFVGIKWTFIQVGIGDELPLNWPVVMETTSITYSGQNRTYSKIGEGGLIFYSVEYLSPSDEYILAGVRDFDLVRVNDIDPSNDILCAKKQDSYHWINDSYRDIRILTYGDNAQYRQAFSSVEHSAQEWVDILMEYTYEGIYGVEDSNLWDMFRAAFDAMTPVFGLALLPGITIGMLLFMPFVVMIILFIWHALGR